MKNIIKYLFFFLAAFAVILLIGGGGLFLATSSKVLLEEVFGIPANSYWNVLATVFVFMLLGVLLTVLVLLVRSRFRKTVVFISFKHVHEAKAIDLEEKLLDFGFGVERLAFSPNYTHDEVVGQVRQKIQRCDVVVTIPDAAKASFVDSELLAASVLKIPIVLIQYQDQQAQPGTLLLGYPVFDYECVKAKNFQPLFRFLLFATRSIRGYRHQLTRTMRQLFDPVALLSFFGLIAIFLFLSFCWSTVRWFLLDVLGWQIGHFVQMDEDINSYLFIVFIIGYTLFSIGRVFHTLSIVRQTIITGKKSYETFVEEFSQLEKDKDMLSCIRQNELIAKK